jgi:hypothetical protein
MSIFEQAEPPFRHIFDMFRFLKAEEDEVG